MYVPKVLILHVIQIKSNSNNFTSGPKYNITTLWPDSLLKFCCGWRDFSSHVFIRVFDIDSVVKIFYFLFFLSSRVHIIYMLLCWLNERIHLHPRFPSRHKDLANLDQSRICLIIVIVIENYVHSSCIQVFLVP